MCMSLVALGRSLTIVSYVAFKMAALWFWTMFNCNPPIAHCHPLLWGGGILVDHWSTISSFMLYIAMHLNYIVPSQQYWAIWVLFVAKWTLGLHFICTKKSSSPWKNTTFVFNRKIRHFPDLRVTQDFFCIEAEVLPTAYQKISIVTKWLFIVTKFFGGGLGL